MKNTIKPLFLLVVLLCMYSCKKDQTHEVITVSEELQIKKINEHSYIHTSYLLFKNGVKFPCNGFIYTNNGEGYIFDSPANDKAAIELINWLKIDMKISIKGVVFNHFHDDCTKGFEIFKKEGISTIASKKTTELLLKEGKIKPDQIFDKSLELKLDNKIVINSFFGEAHTIDNITSYFPDEELLFGGCMIKSIDAKKGNLEDANIKEWSTTVSKIKEKYPKVEIVIPGHGAHGGQELLEYTISLFKAE
ncbi:subclass B1 metallo-beta-lactamase [Aquimarina macrocephali]|uniref:subclass B1 metallo-beta-lactamase n=1 Tax=Aquimarina macrocephali TaxID=666563 RepID=UPI003F663C60